MKYENIELFLDRVKTATNAGSRDVRLSLQEANGLATALAELLTQLHKANADTAPIVLNGGNFKNR